MVWSAVHRTQTQYGVMGNLLKISASVFERSLLKSFLWNEMKYKYILLSDIINCEYSNSTAILLLSIN